MNSLEDGSLQERCIREIRELHRFFENWLSGSLPNTEEAFERVGMTLAPGFRLIHPSGQWRTREEILSGLRKGHGSQPGLTIEIREPQVLRAGEERVLATYEEWQISPDKNDGRISTAVFSFDSDLPDALLWEHVHETWKQAPRDT